MQALSSQTTIVSSPLDVLSQTEQCVVCGDSADGFHYGVRSCRGCNAFFRRAVTYDMQFHCRRGGKCPVDKNARCACRACRLNKCVSVGMDRKAVQPKRETNGTHDVSIKSEPSPNEQGNVPKRPAEKELFFPALPPSPPPEAGLIAKQVHDYKEQKRRRRAMLCNTLHEILADNAVREAELKGRASAEDYSSLFQVQMVLMFEWAEKLPEFRKLADPLDKTKLLRVFALRYILLDNVFHTMELGYTDRLVNNTYMKPLDWPAFDINDNSDERAVKILMFGEELQQLINELIGPISQMQLTMGEMQTLRMIMFWNPGTIGLSIQGLQVAEEASQSAVRELQLYFEAERITDIEKRIGNLLLLLPSFTKHVQYLYDTVKLIPSFGQMKDWEHFMNDLLRGF